MWRRSAATASLCLLSSVLLVSTASATTVQHMADRELSLQADAILIGTVVDIHPSAGGGAPGLWTDIAVRVDTPLKHVRPGETITLTMPGGRQGDVVQYVHGAPAFRIGEQVLLCEGIAQLAEIETGSLVSDQDDQCAFLSTEDDLGRFRGVLGIPVLNGIRPRLHHGDRDRVPCFLVELHREIGRFLVERAAPIDPAAP